ncbi:hypothetical protein DFH29DRAFT_1070103 [Suillus ampliporus]|nr:hypothetical protein DFH29DRAFT_1070103 [Suillus ampliporus]
MHRTSLVQVSGWFSSPCSPSLDFGEHKTANGISPIKKIALLEFGISATPAPAIVPETPVPPYCQTPAPLIVSQNYMYKLVADRWDAEIKRGFFLMFLEIRDDEISGNGGAGSTVEDRDHVARRVWTLMKLVKIC